MSLRLCPDCDHHHRGRCVVCRPCARQRLVTYSGARSFFVSRETVPPDQANAKLLHLNQEKVDWSDIDATSLASEVGRLAGELGVRG